MNKLTVNRVALLSLARRRGQYRAVILGAGLAIFFLSTLFLSVMSIYHSYALDHLSRMGSQDAVLRDAERATPEALIESGLVAEVGSVYVLGETEQSGCAIGYYDEAGARMAHRELTEGRWPEAPGELAVEPNFLHKLRSSAGLGDALELSLKIPSGTMGRLLPDPIKKRYQIVGILKPQSAYLSGNTYNDYEYLKYPSAICSDREAVEPGGRAVIHRLVKFMPDVRFSEFEAYIQGWLSVWNAFPTHFSLLGSEDDLYNPQRIEAQMIIAMALILGAVLVLSACMGIVNAFSTNLSERRSQIGMMRAVGATGRQIRAIFGREALLLAAIICPLAIALSYLFVWGVVSLTGALTFYALPWYLPLIALASLLVVGLAAWVPLMSASKLPPMQAIREVSLLRAKRRIRLRPKATYSPPRLIARRHLLLYKQRQAGIAIVVAMGMLMISMFLPEVDRARGDEKAFGYVVYGQTRGLNALIETDVHDHRELTGADIQEAAALPLVSKVSTAASAQVNMLLDQVTPYLTEHTFINYWSDESGDDIINWEREAAEHLQSQLGLTKEVFPSSIHAFDEEIVAALTPYVLEGEIDMAALKEGREALVCAPRVYYWYILQFDGGDHLNVSYRAPRNSEIVQMNTKDVLFAGDTLPLMRLYTRGELTYNDEGHPNYRAPEILRQDAQVRIGAVLSEQAIYHLSELGGYYLKLGSLVTTHAGLAALGIESAGYSGLGVRLAGSPDDETHDYLTKELSIIAARGDDMELINHVEQFRSDQFWRRMQQLCQIAVFLLLLSMCVSLVNNAITGRLRSDRRAIGTLRAVGASLQEIVRSYQLQALSLTLGGVVLGVLLSCGYYVLSYLSAVSYDFDFEVPFGRVAAGQVAFLALVALFCGINLNARIREITRDSIVSNIREL